jgi:hypothetical protein
VGKQVAGSSSKTTELDHLAQVAKQLGKDLIEVEQDNAEALFPELASHVWATFIELHNGRTYGMSGPHPLSFDIIKSWCDLMGVALNPWEIDTIKSLDNIWITITGEESNG